MMNKKIFLLTLGLLLAIALISTKTSAGFALGFPYEVSGLPGETFERTVSLQNTIEPTSDIQVEIAIINGEEYVSFPQGNLVSLSKNETKNIVMSVTIPEKSKTGQEHPVSLLFKQTGNNAVSQGTVGIGVTISKDFNIKVIGEKSNTKIIVISLILIILIILLIWILIRTISKKK